MKRWRDGRRRKPMRGKQDHKGYDDLKGGDGERKDGLWQRWLSRATTVRHYYHIEGSTTANPKSYEDHKRQRVDGVIEDANHMS